MAELNIVNKEVPKLSPTTHPDVKAKVEGNKWFYTDTVKDHFFSPRNIFKTQEEVDAYQKECDGVGQVGSPACGDMMRMWLKIDKDNDKIVECKWQTFGCASA
ncbi:MAG: iron-sulfur cluster assembly scaffold protein, partial [Candidatus Nanoarchaeia archaeon]